MNTHFIPIKRLSTLQDRRLRIYDVTLDSAVFHHPEPDAVPCFRVWCGNIKSPWIFDAIFAICDLPDKLTLLRANIKYDDERYDKKISEWLDKPTSLFRIKKHTNRQMATLTWDELNPHNPMNKHFDKCSNELQEFIKNPENN